MNSDKYARAERLRVARMAAGYASAKDAADRFGWKYGTYSAHENGNRGLGKAAKDYAKAFKVSEAWLLTGDGQGPSEKDKQLAREVNRIAELVREMRSPERRERILQEARDQLRLDKLDREGGGEAPGDDSN